MQDSARTAHVSSEVEDVLAALDNLLAVVVYTEVHQVEFITEHLLLQVPGALEPCTALRVTSGDETRTVANGFKQTQRSGRQLPEPQADVEERQSGS